jgi:hypothetical protein
MIPRDKNRMATDGLAASASILSVHVKEQKLPGAAAQFACCAMLMLVGFYFSGQVFAESHNIPLGTGSHWHADPGEARMVTVTKDGAGLCNSASFSQIPGHVNLFLGRLKETTGPDNCSGQNWAIALFEIDWDKKELRFVRYILRPPFSIAGDGRTIQSVYDAYPIEFNDSIWMAFECAAPESVSACVAPLDLQNGVDMARISIPVSGGPKSSTEPWQISASDPKLLLYRRRLYLYWTAIRSDEHGWMDGTTRGVELTEDLHQDSLWARNSMQRSVRSNDSKLTTEVWAPTPGDAASDSFVDVFDVFTDGRDVFAIAALGGHGKAADENCLSPAGTSFGCFRLSISKASEPLKGRNFDDGRMEIIGFPENPQEYSRVVREPSGKLLMMGMYLDPPERYAAWYQGHMLARGLMLYPISVN